MGNAMLFLMGFTAIIGVYEIAKTGSKSKTDKMEKTINGYKKLLK